ncbi:hypothetical protein NE237_024607 [Protea cynaroides]|uniref:Uncharacterized protein n=1 Tax=Protea cynaroides TaxID=273540 RepID=A0A9Q0JZC6_9MAGN|nr:hypothetical protein NE237_024607 [Protea cynaroides]
MDLSFNKLIGSLPRLPPKSGGARSQGQFLILVALITGVEIHKPRNAKHSELVAVDLGFHGVEGYLLVNLASYPLLASLSLRHNRFRGPIPWDYYKKLNDKITRV